MRYIISKTTHGSAKKNYGYLELHPSQEILNIKLLTYHSSDVNDGRSRMKTILKQIQKILLKQGYEIHKIKRDSSWIEDQK